MPKRPPPPSAATHRHRRGVAFGGLRAMRGAWPGLTVHGRSEQAAALVSAALASALVVTLLYLTSRTLHLILSGLAAPAQQEVLQAVLGMVMTALIAPASLLRRLIIDAAHAATTTVPDHAAAYAEEGAPGLGGSAP